MSIRNKLVKGILGLLSFGVLVWEIPWVKRLVEWATGIHFLYEESHDPRLEKALQMALNPPPGTALLVGIVGLALIYWSTKPRETRMSWPVLGMLVSLISLSSFGVWYLVENQEAKAAANTTDLAKPEITEDDKTKIAAPFRAQIDSLNRQIAALQAPPPKPAQSPKREFTNKTVRELRAFYVGRTRLQADAFIADEKGKLIEAEGTVVNVDSGMVFLQISKDEFNGMTDYVECRFGPEWNAKLGTYRTGEPMKVRGVIAPSQNGAQIYLQECEIITQSSGNAQPAALSSPSYPNSILTTRYYSTQNKEAIAEILDKTSRVLKTHGEDIFSMAETAINRSAWDRPNEDIQPMIDRMLTIEALSADLKRDLFEELFKQYPDYRVEINNLIFPAEPPVYFEGAAKGFKNALTVWSKQRNGVEGKDRQELVDLINTARSAFAGSRDTFLKWETERTVKIDQTRRALRQ